MSDSPEDSGRWDAELGHRGEPYSIAAEADLATTSRLHLVHSAHFDEGRMPPLFTPKGGRAPGEFFDGISENRPTELHQLIAANRFLALNAIRRRPKKTEEIVSGDFDKNGRHSRVVDDIADSKLVVKVSGLERPVLLKHAIMHNLLLSVRNNGWNEILDHLDASTRGRHVIYLQKNQRGAPTLISSALLLDIDPDAPEGDNPNLCFDPFFVNGWRAEVGRSEIIAMLERYAQSRGVTLDDMRTRLGLNFDPIPAETSGHLEPLIRGWARGIGAENAYGIERYFFDSEAFAFDRLALYHSMTYTTAATSRREFLHAIIEGPIKRRLEVIERKTDLPCHQVFSRLNIKGKDTYNVKLFTKNIAEGGMMIQR